MIPVEPVEFVGGIIGILIAIFGACELFAGEHEWQTCGGQYDAGRHTIRRHDAPYRDALLFIQGTRVVDTGGDGRSGNGR